MELRTLKYFVTIADEGNISRAAERLYLTQPTLSRQMINLEDELGVKLFNREKNSLTLTPEGMLLNHRAQDILYLAGKAENEVSHRGKKLAGVISIGVGEMHGSMEIAEAIAEFQKMHPEVQFNLCGGRETHVREKLDKGLLDLGIVTKPVDTSKLEFVEMKTQEQWSAVMCENSPLTKLDRVRPADFAEAKLIITEDLIGQERILYWLGDYRDKTKIVATFNMEHNAYQLVKSGVGIAICFIKEGFPGEGVCYRPLDAQLDMKNVVAWKKVKERSPVEKVFIDYIKRKFAAMP